MEYEQLEYGNKVLHQCVLTQDVGGFYELLHPDAVLVTHFPYPDASTGAETAAMAALSPVLALIRAEGLGKMTAKQRREQLLRQQAALRDAQEQKYQSYLQARIDAAAGGVGRAREGDPSAEAASAIPTATAAAAESASGGMAAASPSGSPKTATATATAAKRGTRTAAAALPTASRVQAALQGKREHSGLTFFFHQPAPVESMRGAATAGEKDLWASANPPGSSGGARAASAGAVTAGEPTSKVTDLEAAVAAEYGDFVDIAEGRLLVCARFCLLLNWVNQARYVADVTSQLDPRKGVLQDAEVLPAPPVPQTAQQAYAQVGRMYTDRNQLLSRLTITWGREYLVFSDQLFFDDGQVVCIHRRLLTLPEMLQRFPTHGQQWTLTQKVEKIRDELKDLYGVTKSRVAAVSHALPLLDFSFLEIGSDVTRLLWQEVVPVTGRRHACRPECPQADPRLAQGVFLNADNDPTKGRTPTRTLIKAKNKKGEEEAYEINSNARQRYQVFGGSDAGSAAGDLQMDTYGDGAMMMQSGPNGTGDAAVAGHSRRGFKYDATSLRIAGCQLSMPSATTTTDDGSGGTVAGSSSSSGGARAGFGPFATSHAPGDARRSNGKQKPIPFLSILRGLVANAMLTLHTLDLSDNRLHTLPDLSLLPLQKLLLHGNDICDWTEVERSVCSLPYLSSVTLYGNPIADHDPKYWVQALARLVRHPGRRVKLKQLDFVTLTAQDVNQMGVRH